MATTQKYLLLSQTTVMSTELNSLANNALAVGGTPFDNTAGQTGDGSVLCDVELVVTFGTGPNATSGLSIWFLGTQDGTNYEDGSSSVAPARNADLFIPVRSVTTAQRIMRRAVLPPGKFEVLAKNDGTGQSMASSGNTIKIRPSTYQGV